MGLKVQTKPLPFAVALSTISTRGADFDAYVGGWVADYPDPFDFINVLLDGGNIQASNNSNYAYFNNAKYNKQMNDLAKLSGDARYSGYGKLDIEIMRNAAPWAPFANPNSREFISARADELHPSPGLRRRGRQRARDQVRPLQHAGGALRRPARRTTASDRPRNHRDSRKADSAPVPDPTTALGDRAVRRGHVRHVRDLLRHAGRPGAARGGTGRDAGGRRSASRSGSISTSRSGSSTGASSGSSSSSSRSARRSSTART